MAPTEERLHSTEKDSVMENDNMPETAAHPDKVP